MKLRASTDTNAINIPTYFSFKNEFFQDGKFYTIMSNDLSYQFGFQDEKFKKFMESGNMYNVIEMILSHFLGHDLSFYNLKGHQFLTNKEQGPERIIKCENTKSIVPETLVTQIVDFCNFVVPATFFRGRVTPQKLAHRMISKICSRHSERLRRMKKKAVARQNHSE